MLSLRVALFVLTILPAASFAADTQKQYRELILSYNAAVMNQNVQINDRQPLRDHLLRELRHRLDQAIASTPRLQAVAELYYNPDGVGKRRHKDRERPARPPTSLK